MTDIKYNQSYPSFHNRLGGARASPNPRFIVSENRPDSNDETSRISGEILGRYELLSKFATGGMAELFLAREHGAGGLERIVVVKRLLPHLADREESVDMFMREGRLVAQLQHPNVVQTHEFGEEDGEYYLAMEYLHGSTLRELEWLASDARGRLPLWFAVSAIEQVCRGLHAAHELRDLEGNLVKLVHRDVSPQNLMCTVDGYVKLLDFGVAKGAEGEEATHSGRVRGKFSYMSPEQFRQEQLDRRSDLFALGTICWELFTGDRLFKRETQPQTMEAIMTEKPPPPSSVASRVPEELDPIVERALAKDPDERPPTAEAIRRRLLEAAESHDLVREETQLAEFVQSMAAERLETRDIMIQESLERSLTSHERARLRHEQAVDSTKSAAPDNVLSDGRIEPTETEGAGDESTRSEGVWTSRKLVFGGVGLAGLLVCAAVLIWFDAEPNAPASPASSDARGEPTGRPLTYVYPPVQTDEVLQSELAPLAQYLEKTLRRPVKTVVSESYAAASRGLRNGRFDVATLPPLTFVLTRRAEPAVEPLAIREEAGAVTNDGLILVRKSSDVDTLADLRGATFCFTDRNSTSGNFLPRVEIRKRNWTPREFIGKVHWSGNHLQALRDLAGGACEAAATYSGSLLSAENRGIPAAQLRTVAITGHLPSGTVTARPGLAKPFVEKLQQAHLQFDPVKHVGAETVGKTLEITGFREPREELFESLVEAVDRYGQILERFGMSKQDEVAPDAAQPSSSHPSTDLGVDRPDAED